MMDTARQTSSESGGSPKDSAGLEELAVAARDGDHAAFDRLVRAVSGRMLAFATRVLGDRTLAEEAVQESLVRIYRALPRYQSKNFLSWSFTVTYRQCLDLIKRERRSSGTIPAGDDQADFWAAHGTSPDHADGIDVRTSVDAALARIPSHLRSTFLLVQQGLSYEDTAAVLDVPIGTVRSRMHEARKMLRALLSSTFHASGGEVA